MPIRALVYGENVHERKNAVVGGLYPKGMHGAIADALNGDSGIKATTVTLDQIEAGQWSVNALKDVDVMTWWGHVAHDKVPDAVVNAVAERVWEGMGLVVLHSGHFSKIFKKLMGSPCALQWREAGEKERVWVINRTHPIAAGLPASFVVPETEMYGEPFSIPEPKETVFISWYDGGNVFRSGVTYQRGGGNIFYFSPGHEVYPIYHQAEVQHVLRNAVKWAYNPNRFLSADWEGRNVAPHEPIEIKGPVLSGGPRKT
jgi:trehalose utilization protein